MGRVFDFKDTRAYGAWLKLPENADLKARETRLMVDMLKPVRGESVLEIGCGTGTNLLPLLDLHLQVTGLDPSPYMLDIASRETRGRVDLHRGFAESLPFDDNAFTYAVFMTSLEFVDAPQKAIEEACRVVKDRVFLGVLNKYALKGVQRRIEGIFDRSIYNHAHFFSIWELKRMVRRAVGQVPVTWKTICQLQWTPGRYGSWVERIALLQKCPFGAFSGMVVTPVPRFRTRPLEMRYRPEESSGALTG